VLFHHRGAVRPRFDGQHDVAVRSVRGGHFFDGRQLADVRDVRSGHLCRLELDVVPHVPHGQLVRGRLWVL
jgi:hypothetical protein